MVKIIIFLYPLFQNFYILFLITPKIFYVSELDYHTIFHNMAFHILISFIIYNFKFSKSLHLNTPYTLLN